MAIIDLKDGTLKIIDGTGTPNTLTVKIGQGNVQWTETRSREYILDRGKVANGVVRDGDEEPCQVSFDFLFTELRGPTGGTPTVEEALKKIGLASAWVSSAADLCEPYAVDLVFETGAACTATVGQRVTFSDFRYESISHDVRAGSCSVSGRCKEVYPTIIRTSVT